MANKFFLILLLAILCMPALPSSFSRTLSAAVDETRLRQADQDADNWLTHGRTYSEQRYSPLKQIKADNVQRLGLAWFADMNVSRGSEATPIVVDGVIYISTAYSLVKAFDARRGTLLWSFDPQVPKDWLAKACCGPNNRGVAVWEGKVFIGTLDGRLIALNAVSGKPVWSVLTIDPSKPYSITGAPRVVKGKVIIGNAGAEFGVRGYVSAYDARSGKKIWRFYTVPGDPSQAFESPALAKAAKTWKGEWWKLGGGGTVWDAISYDPELDLLYIGVGNGSPWNQKIRSPGGGDNLFLSSIVALKPDTGKYVWHYQTTPGDEWDYTASQQIMLVDMNFDGKPRKLLMQAPKNGFFYVLDRQTGVLLSAEPFIPVNWASGIDMKTGRPIENPEARYSQTGKPWIGMPGPLGAHNWQPMAFNPNTGLVYLPAQEVASPYISSEDFSVKTMGYNLGIDMYSKSGAPSSVILDAIKREQKGYLLAWDPIRQREAWRANYEGPWNGGVLSTAGNLVVQGSAAGDLTIYRADTGEKLWAMNVQSAVMGGPVSYTVDGTQYIAVMSGRDGAFALGAGAMSLKTGQERTISRLLVFSLGGSEKLPMLSAEASRTLNPPAPTADASTVQIGMQLYGRYCGVCHGADAVSGRVVADLRYSSFLQNDAWNTVVLDGALKSLGMAAFAPVLNHREAAAIRAYVIQRANDAKALQPEPGK